METGERARLIFILVLQLFLRVRRNRQQRCRRVLCDRPVFPRGM
ncbi:AC166256.1 [Phodopus roborovskii]|uniref:AC166256.1 protein n=1 Tax=Phodopus roborovskii TaxID=109678 RepID=A0AAU9YSD6_PHORO|nr:AC166256.1 [Phodopus roborovskii]